MFTYTEATEEFMNSNLVIFPGVGAFDHLKWTYDEAFEQLFGPGIGHLNKNFPKIQMPGVVEASI